MSRSDFKGRRLRTDCLAVTPLDQSAVEAIYGMGETLPKHAVDNLCKSHERLRAELSGATILLADAGVRMNEYANENERLRKIACHVPGRIYIKAKEDAGFGTAIRTNSDIG